MNLFALIIEHESEVAAAICEQLKLSGIHIVGNPSNILDAQFYIHTYNPNIVFIGTNTLDSDKLLLAEQIMYNNPATAVILITNHDQLALRAFEIGVLDYIVQPICVNRLYNCIRRVKSHLCSSFKSCNQPPFLAVKNQRGYDLIDQNTILYVASEAKSTHLYHLAANKIKISSTLESLKSIENKLNPEIFIRTHRSYIINLQHINRVESSGQTFLIYFKYGSYMAQLSKNFTSNFYERLNISNHAL